MLTKKSTTTSKWVDPDDAPNLDREWFERAEICEGGRLIRPATAVGRPKKDAPKIAVNIRLHPEVLAYFRAAGRGWQSRINEALRRLSGCHRDETRLISRAMTKASRAKSAIFSTAPAAAYTSRLVYQRSRSCRSRCGATALPFDFPPRLSRRCG
jgi:uncharacterized protein (DUF4415 family)